MENVNKYPNFQLMAEQMLQELPNKVSQHALEFFKKSFENEGFTIIIKKQP